MTVLRLWTHDPNPITMRRPIDARADYWAYCLWCGTLNGPHRTEDQAQHADTEHQSKPCPSNRKPPPPPRLRFSDDDDWIITHNTASDAARILNRNVDSIYWRRKRLRAAGIDVPKDRRGGPTGGTRRRAWTPDQDETVRTSTVAEAAQLLGRTQSSIRNRRYQLQRQARDSQEAA